MTFPVFDSSRFGLGAERAALVPPGTLGALGNAVGMAMLWQGLEPYAELPTQWISFAAALTNTMLARTHVALASHAEPSGQAALLPLCRDPGFFTRWRLLGAREVFEPSDVLFSNPSVVTGLAAKLARDPRPLVLDRIPAESPLISALQDAMRRRGLVIVRPARPCPTIRLGREWSQPETQFNAGRRSDFRRAERRAAALGTVSFEMLSPSPAQFDALFDEAIAVEARSWKTSAGSALAMDQNKADFFRQFFRNACESGQARVAFLRIDGRAVAMQLALEAARRYWLFKIGYDEEYARCSPGTLLMLRSLSHVARQDLLAFEMLGETEPWIVDLWTRDANPCVSLRTYPFGPRGLAALALDTAGWLQQKIFPNR